MVGGSWNAVVHGGLQGVGHNLVTEQQVATQVFIEVFNLLVSGSDMLVN